MILTLVGDFQGCYYACLLIILLDLEAQRMVDLAYQDTASWVKKSITTTARMGKFSSDRAILNYAEVRNCPVLG